MSAAIRYVVLSDLHFGERNGVFTDPDSDSVLGIRPSAALDALAACIHDLARANPEPLRLVLAGDILELALAPEHVAVSIFDAFIHRLFPEGEKSLIHPTLIFLPGNHDHAIWTDTRAEVLAERLATTPRDQPLDPSPHTTPTLSELARPVWKQFVGPESQVLTRMLRHRHPSHPELKVVVGYPNAGLVQDGHTLVVHHGHFTDEIYQLMTAVSRGVFCGKEYLLDLDQLEEDNAAWIDFMWSSLGRQGATGSGIRRGYNLLNSEMGKMLLSTRLAVFFSRSVPGQLARRVRQRALFPLMLRLLDRFHDTDVRNRYATRAEVLPGVAAYVEGPLTRTLARELGKAPEGDVTFIYGHTHQPLATRVPLKDGMVARVYNTGGWVVDTDEPRPVTGGGMVLVDDQLDVVLIRLGMQVDSPHLMAPVVEHADGPGVRQSPLLEAAEALVNRPGGPWRDAALAFANAILRRRAERHEELTAEFHQLSRMERLAVRADRLWNVYHRRKRRSMRRVFRTRREALEVRSPVPQLTGA